MTILGGGPRVVVSTAAFHARVRGSVPGLGGFKETKMFLPHPRVKVSIVGSLRDREVACSASDRQGSNFESCVWRTVSSQSSHHPQEVLLAQFSLYVHKGGLKPDSFHFISLPDSFHFIYHDNIKYTLWISLAFLRVVTDQVTTHSPANTRRLANAGLMLDQCLRRCPNIESVLGQRLCLFGQSC